MRLVTFETAANGDKLGAQVDDHIIDLALGSEAYRTATGDKIPVLPSDMMTFLGQGDAAINASRKVIEWVSRQIEKTGRVTTVSGDPVSYDLDQVRLRAPVPRPSKILCLALNYRAHATEGNIVMPERPYVFIKPGIWPVMGPNDKVIRPTKSQNFLYEGELAVVIGKRCRHVSSERAYEVIAGYTVVNDMSARDLGKTNIPGLFDWFRAKAFDTSLPMGPCLTLKDEIADPHNLRLTVRVNGQTVQDASTAEMAFWIPELIEFISEFITLDAGDIIATGTPGGSTTALKAGDRVEVEITKIGVLTSIIVDEDR